MDKRVKHHNLERVEELRGKLFQGVISNEISIAEAVKLMHLISPLTQPEFAKYSGISLQSLKQVIAGKGNPTVDTLNKIAAVYGLQVGFVPIQRSHAVKK